MVGCYEYRGWKEKSRKQNETKVKNNLASTSPWVSTENWISKHDVVSSPASTAGEGRGGAAQDLQQKARYFVT